MAYSSDYLKDISVQQYDEICSKTEEIARILGHLAKHGYWQKLSMSSVSRLVQKLSKLQEECNLLLARIRDYIP